MLDILFLDIHCYKALNTKGLLSFLTLEKFQEDLRMLTTNRNQLYNQKSALQVLALML